MSQKPPVHITGLGAICAIGSNVNEIHESLRDGISGIEKTQYLNVDMDFESVTGEVALTNKELAAYSGVDNSLPRTTLLAIKAIEEAIMDAGFVNIEDQRTGIIVGTTVGGMDKTERLYKTDTSPAEYIPSHHCGFTTDFLSSHFGIVHYCNTISTACSSGANSLLTAARLIQQDKLDMVIAGGTDALSAFTLNGFNSLMILDPEPCRPFSAERKGLNLGEGAAFVVLESEKSIRTRKGKSICRLSGFANTNDAFHQTASSPDGRGAYQAMQQAINNAGLNPENIDYINAHGTGTENNDLTENIAIRNTFGKHKPEISTTKPYTGHCLGAAGALESVFSILTLQHQEVYPNLRLGTPILDEGLIPVKEFNKKEVNHVLSNSFGFGGCDTSLVFSK